MWVDFFFWFFFFVCMFSFCFVFCTLHFLVVWGRFEEEWLFPSHKRLLEKEKEVPFLAPGHHCWWNKICVSWYIRIYNPRSKSSHLCKGLEHDLSSPSEAVFLFFNERHQGFRGNLKEDRGNVLVRRLCKPRPASCVFILFCNTMCL